MEPFAAGIIPYIHGPQFLLGLEKSNNKWSGFVGGSETGETPIETALREFNEETCMIFKDHEAFFYSKLTTTQPVIETTPSGKIVYLWFIKCPASLFGLDFNQFYINQRLTDNRYLKEKSQLVLFDLQEIKSYKVLYRLKQTILKIFGFYGNPNYRNS